MARIAWNHRLVVNQRRWSSFKAFLDDKGRSTMLICEQIFIYIYLYKIWFHLFGLKNLQEQASVRMIASLYKNTVFFSLYRGFVCHAVLLLYRFQ